LESTEEQDIKYMREAVNEASKAIESGEVPIGCVIVYKDEIIGRGHNLRNSKKNPLCHAEISAINEAAGFMGDWRLEECTLYVTVEPCPMCAGAIVQARIPRVVFGTPNVKAGCAGSILNILNEPKFNHQVDVTCGVLREECAAPMSEFFKRFRKKNKETCC
jgi:tRNA(adenine34) deaminase